MSMGGYFKHTKFRTDNLPCIGMSAVSMCRCAASPPDTTRQFTSGYRMKWWWARWALGATQLGGSAVILRETPPTESLMVAWGHLASPRGPYTPPLDPSLLTTCPLKSQSNGILWLIQKVEVFLINARRRMWRLMRKRDDDDYDEEEEVEGGGGEVWRPGEGCGIYGGHITWGLPVP